LRLKEKEWMALGELADLMQMQREELEKDIGTLRQQDEELIETLDRRIA
jgi:biotin operon repressor